MWYRVVTPSERVCKACRLLPLPPKWDYISSPSKYAQLCKCTQISPDVRSLWHLSWRLYANDGPFCLLGELNAVELLFGLNIRHQYYCKYDCAGCKWPMNKTTMDKLVYIMTWSISFPITTRGKKVGGNYCRYNCSGKCHYWRKKKILYLPIWKT